MDWSERPALRGDSVRTSIGNYAYDVRNELGVQSDGLARWFFMVYRLAPTEELVTIGESSPNQDHAERNARQVIALYAELDRMSSNEPGSPRRHAIG